MRSSSTGAKSCRRSSAARSSTARVGSDVLHVDLVGVAAAVLLCFVSVMVVMLSLRDSPRRFNFYNKKIAVKNHGRLNFLAR